MFRVVTAAGLAGVVLCAATPALAEEQPVDPYVQSDANAGAQPFKDDRLYRAFHGQAGVSRIVDRLVDENAHDPRTADFFRASDLERVRRTLKEQFCYILGGPCHYTGRDMRATHRDQGIQQSDFNAVVEHLRDAMRAEGVSFRAQNKLLAKMAPMERQMVER
jgi:hemoglobin